MTTRLQGTTIHGGDVYGRSVRDDFSVSVNPCPRPDAIRDALIAAVDRVDAYPDPLQRELRAKLAELDGVAPQEIWVGAGASELFLGIANALRPKRALIATPSFYGYRHALAAVEDCELVEYRLEPEKGFAVGEELLELLTEEIDVLFLGSPNNPTGKRLAPELAEQILTRSLATGTSVVLDECFLRLTSDPTTLRRRVGAFPNLYVVDAFTKLFALPGVRVGYLVSCSENIERIRRRLPEWNMSTFAEAASLACRDVMTTTDYVAASVREIAGERERLANALRALGMTVFDSDANFLLFYSATPLFRPLLERAILIRDCRNFDGLAHGYYRVAVKTRAENARLVDEIAKILETIP